MLLGLYPLSIIVFLITGTILLILKKAKNLGRILILLSAGEVLFFGWILSAFTFTAPRYGNLYFTLVGVFSALLLILLGLILWKKWKEKRFILPVIGLMLACLITAGVTKGIQQYHESIPTVGEPADLLARYTPDKTNGNLASLKEEATLQFTEDYPRIDGATAMYPLYSAVAVQVFPEKVAEDIPCSTTTGAYERLISGSADLIFAGGPSKEQLEQAKEQGVELVLTPIGKEAFVFFVNAKNPLNDITVAQIKDVYSGKTTQWKQLGVEKLGKIRAFQREEGSGSQTALQKLMGELPLMNPPKEDIIDGMGGIIRRAADYKNYANALGYSFRFYSNEMVGNNQIKLLSVEGKEPTLKNIENGSYPLASEFYAVTRSDASENTKKLLEWLTGPQGQELVEKTGYTPIK